MGRKYYSLGGFLCRVPHLNFVLKTISAILTRDMFLTRQKLPTGLCKTRRFCLAAICRQGSSKVSDKGKQFYLYHLQPWPSTYITIKAPGCSAKCIELTMFQDTSSHFRVANSDKNIPLSMISLLGSHVVFLPFKAM